MYTFFRAIKDSRKIHNEDSKLNEKPKRVPSWKRHLIEKKKNKSGRVYFALLHLRLIHKKSL